MTNINAADKEPALASKPSKSKPLKIRVEGEGRLVLGSPPAEDRTPQEVEASLRSALDTFGCLDSDFITRLINQVVNVAPNHSQEDLERWANAILAAIHGIKPRDPLEAMLAAQMVASHTAGMECARRAFLAEQTTEGTSANINRMTKMMRTFTAQVEALQKYRHGGQQTVTVQRVSVQDGGQAVVGNIRSGGAVTD